MKPLLWWENWGGISLHCFHGEKQKWRHVHSTSFQVSLHIHFPQGTIWSKASANLPHQNKSFTNYVSCRNWAVRKPAGTRLDSSLVNKQVVHSLSQTLLQARFGTGCEQQLFIQYSLIHMYSLYSPWIISLCPLCCLQWTALTSWTLLLCSNTKSW